MGFVGRAQRFCTFVMYNIIHPDFLRCVRAAGEQPRKLGVIFEASSGERLQAEKSLYHHAVEVTFQRSAWADSKSLCNLLPVFELSENGLLFMDSLASHRGEFQKAIESRAVKVWYGPPRLTDTWQPVDRQLGKWVKDKARKYMYAICQVVH